MNNDFTFMVFADEPFTSLGVEKIDLPIPVSIATAISKAAATGQDVPLDLPTLRDFVMVCCQKHPELATRCLPAKCCLAFLFGKQALSACTQMLSTANDMNDAAFIDAYNSRLAHSMAQMTMACELAGQWTAAPLFLKHNCHWYMARLYMLAHSEDQAIAELNKVITICGSHDLVPDVWLALAGIHFSRQQETRAVELLHDYVHRATTLFPERTSEFLRQGQIGAMARQYAQVREYFERLEK